MATVPRPIAVNPDAKPTFPHDGLACKKADQAKNRTARINQVIGIWRAIR